MQDKYFYIICRDGQIIEVKNKKETFDAVFGAMTEKGVVILKDYGTVLNGVDISRVLNLSQYDNWIYSSNPREFIKDGIWYDGKERKIIRRERWKQEEFESRKKLTSNEIDYTTLSSDQMKEIKERTKMLMQKYKPDFLK